MREKESICGDGGRKGPGSCSTGEKTGKQVEAHPEQSRDSSQEQAGLGGLGEPRSEGGVLFVRARVKKQRPELRKVIRKLGPL